MPQLFAATLAVLLLVASGQAASQPCEGRYPRRTELLPASIAQNAGVQSTRAWGLQNLTPLPDDSAGFRLHFPAGSINPGNPQAPVGGAGFLWPLSPVPEARCISYRLRFAENFDFVRGGKLPGIYGGEGPTGCSRGELARGFSARLMWREDGQGELYLYAPDRTARCGESIGRGAWHFAPGQWIEVAQEVVMNRPGQADGTIRIWIDGRRVLERTGLHLRTVAEVRPEGLIFSSFFGGNDRSWASPRDQGIDFTALSIWDEPPHR